MATNSRLKVSRVADLRRGDHIVIDKSSYEYHGIVVTVNPDEDKFDLIGAESGGIIESKTVELHGENSRHVYVIQYDVQDCLPPTQVIDNALGMVGERVGRCSEKRSASKSAVVADGGDDERRRRQPVTKIEDLKPGDHVAFQRRGYEHHGIVISVHPDEDIFNVAEVFKGNEGGGKINFATRPHKFSEEKKDSVSVVEYEKGECLPASEVIRNASRLDGTSVEYDLLDNNCEHYASAIKTGEAISEQIKDLEAKVDNTVTKFLPFMVVGKVFSLLKRVILRKYNVQSIGPMQALP